MVIRGSVGIIAWGHEVLTLILERQKMFEIATSRGKIKGRKSIWAALHVVRIVLMGTTTLLGERRLRLYLWTHLGLVSSILLGVHLGVCHRHRAWLGMERLRICHGWTSGSLMRRVGKWCQ